MGRPLVVRTVHLHGTGPAGGIDFLVIDAGSSYLSGAGPGLSTCMKKVRLCLWWTSLLHIVVGHRPIFVFMHDTGPATRVSCDAIRHSFLRCLRHGLEFGFVDELSQIGGITHVLDLSC